MARNFTHRVLLPVKHNGIFYKTGDPITLTDKEAASLGDRVIALNPAAASAPSITDAALSPSTLGKLTIAELTDYAGARGITVPEGSTKDQIIALLAVPAGA